MRLLLLVGLGMLVLGSGCSTNDDAAQKLAEQQKINLDVQKHNEETLEKISEKENEIAAQGERDSRRPKIDRISEEGIGQERSRRQKTYRG